MPKSWQEHDDDDLIAELRRVHDLTGRDVLTKEDFNRLSVTCYEVVWTHFGRQPRYAEVQQPPSLVGPKSLRWKMGKLAESFN